MKLPEDLIEHRLANWPVARLATVGARGEPHQVPIVFVHLRGALWSPVDGKPKSGNDLVRVRNARERPAVSLLLDEYTEDWERLWWLRVDASAQVLESEVPAQEARFVAALEALGAKYPQYAEVPMTKGRATLLAFRIERVRSWCAGSAAARV